MAQAAVTLQAQNFFHRHPSRLSCRRRSSDDESSLDEDPSWQPSEFKPRRKRRCRDVHSQQVCTSLPHSPPAVSPYSCVPAANTREGITVELTKANNDLWENFRSLGTEMIICKEGRRMFPSVEVVIKGLQLNYIYSVFISIMLKDQCRYRYNNKTGWMKMNVGAQPSIPYRMVPHADSRNAGSHFMRKPLSFKTIKMTNNLNTKRDDQLILLSMRSYVPLITIHCHTTGEDTVHTLSTCDFIAVTSYQRMEVTRLKIETNQFAAAFRKRNRSLPEESREGSTESDDTTADGPHALSSEPDSSVKYSPYSKQVPSVPEPEFSTNTSDESPSASCFVEDDISTTHPPTTPTAYISDEGGDDDSIELCCVENNYTEEPAHIRPFMFQPQYHCGLSNTVYPLNFGRSCPPDRPKHSVGLNRQSLWSSVAVLGPISMVNAPNLSDESDCLSLGLISDFLSL